MKWGLCIGISTVSHSGFNYSLIMLKWISRLDRVDWNILVGKPEGKTQLGRPRRRWKDSIKMVRK
jgi:hypothetical protein